MPRLYDQDVGSNSTFNVLSVLTYNLSFEISVSQHSVTRSAVDGNESGSPGMLIGETAV